MPEPDSSAAPMPGPDQLVLDTYRLACQALDRLVADIGASGVEHDDSRLGYVTVQIDRDVWDRVQEVVRHPMRTVPDA